MPNETPFRLEIHYCPGCRWLPRAAWMAQEFLTTFAQDLHEVALLPASSGTFRIVLNGEELFCRKAAGRFAEPKEIKALIRDRINPDLSLGHSEPDSHS
ncbi:MAG: SelT/SelW/SelH family protein [Opitutales bacterium]|nr:SelT/SelW/SelH family protein [Opitutales bacterium]